MSHEIASRESVPIEPSGGSRGLIDLLRSSWWLILIAGVVGGVAALIINAVQTPVYESTATLYVNSAAAGGESGYQGVLASQQSVSSYAKLIDSDTVLKNVITKSRLDMSPEDVSQALTASTNTTTVLISVSARNADAALAARLANAGADSLSEYVATLEQPAGGGQPSARLTVTKRATASAHPMSPNTVKNTALGVVSGLLVGFLLALGRRHFRSPRRDDSLPVSH